MRPPIKSKKHINQISQSVVTQGNVVSTTIVDSIEATATTPSQVEEGAIVKACYVEFWVGNESSSTIGSYTWVLSKLPSGLTGPTTTNMAALHDWENKKNILFTGQGLLPPDVAGIVPVVRGWYKIPKGKQRFGLGDKLKLTVRNNNSTDIDIEFCGLAIYKEYT